MFTELRKCLKIRGNLNICICEDTDVVEKKAYEIANCLNLPIQKIDITELDIFEALAKVRKINNNSLVYMTGLDSVKPIKQVAIMPFIDGRIKRKNSICVIKGNEKPFCNTMMHKFDFVF